MTSTYEPITTQTLGSNQSSITLSSIPQTYTDLIVIASGESTSGGSMLTRFNSDTGSNYSTTYLYGTGSGAASASNTNQSVGIFMMRTPTNALGGGILHINNYSNTTTYKTGLSRSIGYDPIVWLSCGLWRSTAAISTITFTDESSGNFKTGFTVTLYGIKAE